MSSHPDPMDGLHLALLQRQRERLRVRASFRSFIPIDGMVALLLICGIVITLGASAESGSQMLKLGIGLLLICEAIYLWLALRFAARKQLRKLEQQLATEEQRPDAAAISEAATAARTFILKQQP